MKTGICTIALRKYNIFHALDLAAEAGFRGVEIWGKPPHTPDEFDEEHTLKIRDRLRQNGLRVSMFGSYARPMLPDFEHKSEDAIKISKILGARKIRVWAGNKEPHEADEEMWKFVTSNLRNFALKAGDEGITLAMEMHSSTLASTPEGVIRLIEMANVPNLALNFQVIDFANPDLEKAVDMLGGFVVNVHAQNYRPSKLNPEIMKLSLIKDGTVDYPHLLSLLSKKGFKGYVEVEFLKGENVSDEVMLESLKQDSEYLTEITKQYSD